MIKRYIEDEWYEKDNNVRVSMMFISQFIVVDTGEYN